MRIAIISTLLLLLVDVSSTTTSECKTLCADSRTQLLEDNSTCKPALKHSSGGNQKSFHLCVEGRKKGLSFCTCCDLFIILLQHILTLPVTAFQQACIPICKGLELEPTTPLVVTSYDGCKSIAKKHSNQAFSWCRKGYESVLSSLSPLLDTLKKIDKEQKSIETTAAATITKESVVVSEPSVTIENTVVPVAVESVVKTDVNISKVEETAQNESVVEKKIEEPVEKKIEEEPVKKIEPIVRKPINTYRHQEQVVNHKPADDNLQTSEAKDEREEEPLVDEVKEKLDKKEDKTTEEESAADIGTIASHDDSASFRDDNKEEEPFTEEKKEVETEETEL